MPSSRALKYEAAIAWNAYSIAFFLNQIHRADPEEVLNNKERSQKALRTMALAERSGNPASLVRLLHHAGMSSLISSDDMCMILTLADRALELALREGCPGSLLFAHSLQVQARFVCATSVAQRNISRRRWSLPTTRL